MTNFKDHFSALSSGYAAYRPSYPAELFVYLASLVDEHAAVWDCATGSGQAAVALTGYFDRVLATDASASQIENAPRHEKISFRIARAENSGLEDDSQNLVTVAQALHWFDLDAFYTEVRRVLKAEGVLAVWSYNLFRLTPEIDRVIEHFYRVTLEDYWPPERQFVENGYRDLPFPAGEIDTPEFAMTAEWSLEHLLGYLNTWSAVKRFNQSTGRDGVAGITPALRDAWPAESTSLPVSWPLSLRVARLDR